MRAPKIDRYAIGDEALLLICDNPLSLEELEADADSEDTLSVERISAPSRRQERLMWRWMLRKEFSSTIKVEYTPSGRPEIKDFPYQHISVSHCRDVVAVVASQRVCGVDVERKERNFERIAERYTTSEERALCQEAGMAREEALATMWCAKECMYKAARREGVDFRRDVLIEAIDPEQGRVVGRVAGGEPIEMTIIDAGDYLVVYSC